MVYIGLGLNFKVVFEVGFLIDVRDILDFAVFGPTRNSTDSRLLKFSKKLEVGGPY
jgi:hypothetical protein